MVNKEGESNLFCGGSHHFSYFRKNKIDTVNKTEKSQASNKTLDKPKSNKNDTVKPLDKSRSTQITDTKNTVDKSISIPRSNCSNKSTRKDNPSEIHVYKDNLSVSGLPAQRESLSSETSDTICITHNSNRKKTPDTLIIRKHHIQEPFNPSKREK